MAKKAALIYERATGKMAGTPYCSFKFAVISIYFYALVTTFLCRLPLSAHYPYLSHKYYIYRLTAKVLLPD